MYNKETCFCCLVVGSRSINDYNIVREKLDSIIPRNKYETILILSGGANGVDKLAERYATEQKYLLKVMPADWSKGKQAGYQRNVEMHKLAATYPHRGCIAFWDGESKGTAHSFSLAIKKKIFKKISTHPLRVLTIVIYI